MKLIGWLTWIAVIGGIVGVVSLWLGVGLVVDGSAEIEELSVELYKITYRFCLLVVLGGAVSLLYKEFSRARAREAKELEEQREEVERALDAARARVAAKLDKIRDQNRLLASQLFSAYGEFVAIWKAWNYSKEWQYYERDSAIPVNLEELFQRALAAEGSMESLLVGLASRQVLTPEQLKDLAQLRQAFQQLRERMRNGESIPWASSRDNRYRYFKRLVTVVGTLLSSPEQIAEPTPKQAYEAWLEITSNKHEGYWD